MWLNFVLRRPGIRVKLCDSVICPEMTCYTRSPWDKSHIHKVLWTWFVLSCEVTWYRVKFCECVICPEMTWCYWQDISIQELTKLADPWFNKQNLWEWGIWRWNFELKKKEMTNQQAHLARPKRQDGWGPAPSWFKCWLNNCRNTHQPKAGIILCFTVKDKLVLSHASSVLSLTSSILICLPTVFVLPAYAVICARLSGLVRSFPFPSTQPHLGGGHILSPSPSRYWRLSSPS